MKKIGYLLFALIFQICRCLPVQRKKVVLYNGHHRELSGNLLAMKQEIMRHSDDAKFYYFGKHTRETGGVMWKVGRGAKFFFQLPFQMATAGQVFLNDNFLPLGYCRPSEKTQMIQLWHGAGAFKKFGLSTERNRKVREQVKRANLRITHLFVTSKQIIPYYSEAFAISYERIFATGIPVSDIYCDSQEKRQRKNRFYREYPELQGKKLLLVAPTFRNTPEENRELLERLALDQMENVLGEDWIILLRMHPKYPVEGFQDGERCRNLTDYPHVSDLYFASDMLLTDYSSTMVEYSLLDKPMIFYAYDLEKYDRGFYWDYEEGVPGPVAHDVEELLNFVAAARVDLERGTESEKAGEPGGNTESENSGEAAADTESEKAGESGGNTESGNSGEPGADMESEKSCEAEENVESVKSGEAEKRERFRRMQYDFTDDASAERIWKVLAGNRK